MSKDASLRQAYTELAKAETTGNYEAALRTCNRILKAYPREATAVRCKVVSLVQLSKFEDCLTLLRKTAPDLTAGSGFEKAYCEYRLNRTDESLATLNDLENTDTKLSLPCLELKGQLLYRNGAFEECQKIYTSLLRDSVDDYDSERRANLLAVQANLTDTGANVPNDGGACDTYEQLYNSACELVACGKYSEAVVELVEAAALCREALNDEGANDDEIDDELALVNTQLNYCKQMIHGNTQQVLNQYLAILKTRPSDAVVNAVACNNAVSARKDLNLFDARKKMKNCLSSSLDNKLTNTQKLIVTRNNAILLLLSNQLEPCRRAIVELKDKLNGGEEAVIIEAALNARQKDGQKLAEQILQTYIKHNKAKPNLSFALAHMQITQGKTLEGVETLCGIDFARWTPGVLSLAVASKGDDKKAAVQQLAKAIQYYGNSKTNKQQMCVVLQQAATLCSQMEDHKQAAEFLDKLSKLKPEDRGIVSQLIQEYSHFDQNKAQQLSRTLERNEGTSELQCNVDEVEELGWVIASDKYKTKKVKNPTPKPATNKKDEEMDEDDQIVQRKRKNRKRKKRHLPKEYDPSGPGPDPERWLPKYERSTFKRKKDRRNRDRDVGRGTQGGMSANAGVGLDSTGSPKPNVETPASPKAPIPGPRQQRPTKKPPTKKKKGGKW